MKLLVTSIAFGGPGKVVQIEESLFNHKPKLKLSVYISHDAFWICDNVILYLLFAASQRKSWNETWVFGMADTSKTPALGFMQLNCFQSGCSHINTSNHSYLCCFRYRSPLRPVDCLQQGRFSIKHCRSFNCQSFCSYWYWHWHSAYWVGCAKWFKAYWRWIY